MTRWLASAARLAATHTVADPTRRAFLAGTLIGSVVWALAQARPDDAFGFAMACVFMVSGSLAFVCHALSLETAGRERLAGWVTVLGAGLWASLSALDLLAGWSV